MALRLCSTAGGKEKPSGRLAACIIASWLLPPIPPLLSRAAAVGSTQSHGTALSRERVPRAEVCWHPTHQQHHSHSAKHASMDVVRLRQLLPQVQVV